MYEVDAASGDTKQVSSLDAHLYDIGPMPHFFFKVEVAQLGGGSPNASRAALNVERYMLLRANGTSVYEGLSNAYPDAAAPPAWVYHGPVPLNFSRSTAGDSTVIFTSEPQQLSFLDPENPITYARPMDFKIIGFAYRFILTPASFHQRDINPADNAYQLEFLKP